MSAIELFHQDGKAAGVWYCSECRAVHLTYVVATQCHGVLTCEKCGNPVERRGYTVCNACDGVAFSARAHAAELAHFQAAEKIPAAEYEGPVYAEGVGPEWFESLDEYREHLENDDAPPALYVWAGKDVGVHRVATEDVTESLLDGMWEDADESDLNGIDELAAALEVFNQANESVVVWNVDYSRAIVLEPEAAEAVI